MIITKIIIGLFVAAFITWLYLEIRACERAKPQYDPDARPDDPRSYETLEQSIQRAHDEARTQQKKGERRRHREFWFPRTK